MKKRVMTKADAKSIKSLNCYSLDFTGRYLHRDLVELVNEAHECWNVSDDKEMISIMGYFIDLLITAVYNELED